MMFRVLGVAVLLFALTGSTALSQRDTSAATPSPAPTLHPDQALVNKYCTTCHGTRMRSGNLVLTGLDVGAAGAHAEVWERVVRKLRNGLMPPAGSPRPDDAAYAAFRTALEERLDAAAALRPEPGRTETAHRLNRLEYQNAVRDLLALDLDVRDLLPADDSSYGFDNIGGVLKVSPALIERYLAAARVVSRAAVGSPPPAVDTAVYRISAETQQHDRHEQLPIGTRGGTLIHHQFPQSAEYDIRVEVAGGSASDAEQLEITIDGLQTALFAVEPRKRLEVRVPVGGGPHEIGVAFYRRPLHLVERVREPFQNPAAPSGLGGPAGTLAAVSSVAIVGPFNAVAAGDTPSRRRVFICTPAGASQEPGCARTILTALARRAYRAPVGNESVEELLAFYRRGRDDGGTFEDGIEFALRRLLVSPEFLYRIESDALVSAGGSPGLGPAVRPLTDYELASRLSFFLWSSIPDAELLDLAAQGKLRDPRTFERQVLRMLADPRSETLTTNFASQWLMTRNLAMARPGENYALNFDETLRVSMQRETELFVGSIVRENRSVVDLLTADYTFLNERLAVHYGIPNIQGSHFRRVSLPADSPRRGLLGHGSILTITSPSIRTSPVIRGKWILNNILGAPPPDPPPNVPALSEQRTQAKTQTMRERMSQHRANPACASCHSMIDPAGFALENFDATGRWRIADDSHNVIDASGALPDGVRFNGVAELRAALARRPDRFVHTATEKLLTYALGRGLEYYDMPAVRRILRDTEADGYRMQSIILGVARSYPFQYRRIDPTPSPGRVAP